MTPSNSEPLCSGVLANHLVHAEDAVHFAGRDNLAIESNREYIQSKYRRNNGSVRQIGV